MGLIQAFCPFPPYPLKIVSCPKSVPPVGYQRDRFHQRNPHPSHQGGTGLRPEGSDEGAGKPSGWGRAASLSRAAAVARLRPALQHPRCSVLSPGFLTGSSQHLGEQVVLPPLRAQGSWAQGPGTWPRPPPRKRRPLWELWAAVCLFPGVNVELMGGRGCRGILFQDKARQAQSVPVAQLIPVPGRRHPPFLEPRPQGCLSPTCCPAARGESRAGVCAARTCPPPRTRVPARRASVGGF